MIALVDYLRVLEFMIIVKAWDRVVTTNHERYNRLLKDTPDKAYIASKILHKTLERFSLDCIRSSEDRTAKGSDMSRKVKQQHR